MTASRQIVVALSGGVDSSVAALLLQREGYQVVAVTLQLQRCESNPASRSCCGVDSVVRARQAAARLGLRHYVLDSVAEFEERVLAPSWNEYDRGRTPSPCLRCNEQIKFGTLLAWARELGALAVATGHYARIRLHAGEPSLWRGVDTAKDQSYFLAGLSREQLSQTRFPLGDLRKEEVRRIAAEAGLPTASQQESQDACLVGTGEVFAEVLRQRFAGPSRSGPVVDEQGQQLGTHEGLHRFTVGQRRGLGIASLQRSWVKSLDAATSTVVLTRRSEALLASRVAASEMCWVGSQLPAPGERCSAQVRSQQRAAGALVEEASANGVQLRFDQPVRAVAAGQALVLYEGERVLGRGWIDHAEA